MPSRRDSYGNFDIILDHFPRISQLQPTPHALWAVFYLMPRLTSCRLVLAIRCYVQFGASGRLDVLVNNAYAGVQYFGRPGVLGKPFWAVPDAMALYDVVFETGVRWTQRCAWRR